MTWRFAAIRDALRPVLGLPKPGSADAAQGDNNKPRGRQMNMKRDAEVGELTGEVSKAMLPTECEMGGRE